MKIFKKLWMKMQRYWIEFKDYKYHQVSIYNEGGEMKIFIGMEEVVLPENSSADFIAKMPASLVEQMLEFGEKVERGEVEEVSSEE